MIYFRKQYRKIKQFIISTYLESTPFYRRYQPFVSGHVLHRTTSVGHINDKVKMPWIYFRVPKAANSTILLRLYGMYASPDLTSSNLIKNIKGEYFQGLQHLKRNEVDNLDNYFKFSFVRNPYDRFLSCYLNKIKRKDSVLRDLVSDSLSMPRGSEISIELFLEYLERGGLCDNSHWATQTSLIPIPIKSLDFIGKIESLDIDLLYVMQRLGVAYSSSMDLSWSKYATGASKEEVLLTDSIKRKLRTLYAVDFNNFGYTE